MASVYNVSKISNKTTIITGVILLYICFVFLPHPVLQITCIITMDHIHPHNWVTRWKQRDITHNEESLFAEVEQCLKTIDLAFSQCFLSQRRPVNTCNLKT